MHLETDRPRTRLALTLPHGILSQAGQIFAAHTLGGKVLYDLAGTTIVHEDLQVHFGLAAQLVDIAQKLALVGADGFSQTLIVVEDRSKPERQHRGVLETIGDYPGVVHARFLIEIFRWVMFADDDGEVAGGVKKYLISANAEDSFHWNGFAMTGQFRKSLLFTNAVGIPCHDGTLRTRAPVNAALWWNLCELGNNCILACCRAEPVSTQSNYPEY